MNIQIRFLLPVLLVAAHITVLAEKPSQAQQRLAIAAVRSQLKDPASAVFSNFDTFVVGGSRRICGEVNAKNAYGGYNGPIKFWTVGEEGRISMVTFDTPDKAGLVDRLCDYQNALAADVKEKILQKQMAENEKTAICSEKTTALTKGDCGLVFEKCSKEFSFLQDQERRDFVTVCLQKGILVAQDKFRATLGASISFN